MCRIGSGTTRRDTLPAVWLALVWLTAVPAPTHAQRPEHGRLFPPQDLGMLEGPDREAWQRPDRIMDMLGIADGARVAEVGAGGGWFTIRLAKRVGPNGLVYAEDIQRQMIDSMERRFQREGLKNVLTVLGREDDPRLPDASLDAVVCVDTFHEIAPRRLVLEHVRDALKPAGRLGIVDFKANGAGPGPPNDERVEPAEIIALAESVGFVLLEHDASLPYHYLLVFGRAARTSSPR